TSRNVKLVPAGTVRPSSSWLARRGVRLRLTNTRQISTPVSLVMVKVFVAVTKPLPSAVPSAAPVSGVAGSPVGSGVGRAFVQPGRTSTSRAAVTTAASKGRLMQCHPLARQYAASGDCTERGGGFPTAAGTFRARQSFYG